MKLYDNLISKQTELIKDKKEFWKKFSVIEAKFYNLTRKIKLFRVNHDCRINFGDPFH